MIAQYLQDNFVVELQEIFEKETFKTPDGERGRLNVYAQELPIQVAKEEKECNEQMMEEGLNLPDIEQEDPYPYIIVQVKEGEIEEINGEQNVVVNLLIGIYDENFENQGHRDVLHIIQKIYERFAKNPILAKKYECAMPFSWALQDEESYPYYFGGIEMNFKTVPIRREDRWA